MPPITNTPSSEYYEAFRERVNRARQDADLDDTIDELVMDEFRPESIEVSDIVLRRDHPDRRGREARTLEMASNGDLGEDSLEIPEDPAEIELPDLSSIPNEATNEIERPRMPYRPRVAGRGIFTTSANSSGENGFIPMEF